MNMDSGWLFFFLHDEEDGPEDGRLSQEYGEDRVQSPAGGWEVPSIFCSSAEDMNLK